MAEIKTVTTNRRARHEYHILDTLIVGVCLTGSEVKSLRDNNATIEGAFVRIINEEVFLIGSHIGEYKQANQKWDQHIPTRDRKLLLKKREIRKFAIKSDQKGLTIIPLKIFFNEEGRAKIEIAVAQGKKLHDKRQSEKKKQADLDIKRSKK